MPDSILPKDDEHTVVVGQNGTGKSQFGAWLLSTRPLKRKVHFLIDYKGEDLFNSLERARHIDFSDNPKKPGLYILHAGPGDEDEVKEFLWKIWRRENVGLFVDEAYMLPPEYGKNRPFEAILTQGRSKRIPVITLSQRPVKVSRFVFSEAAHLVAFNLSDKRDRKTLTELAPEDFFEWVPPEYRETGIPPYHARWYSVKANAGQGARYLAKPVPDADTIREAIDSQLEPKRRVL